MFVNIWSILVSPTHVCYVSGLPQAFLFFLRHTFFEKAQCVQEREIDSNPTHYSKFDKYKENLKQKSGLV